MTGVDLFRHRELENMDATPVLTKQSLHTGGFIVFNNELFSFPEHATA